MTWVDNLHYRVEEGRGIAMVTVRKLPRTECIVQVYPLVPVAARCPELRPQWQVPCARLPSGIGHRSDLAHFCYYSTVYYDSYA